MNLQFLVRRTYQMTDKTRVSVTMTTTFIKALDSLVEDGFYLNRGEAILEALRIFLETKEIKPFYNGKTSFYYTKKNKP